MFFVMQIIFIVLPSNMAAVQNLYMKSQYQWNPRVSSRIARELRCLKRQQEKQPWKAINCIVFFCLFFVGCSIEAFNSTVVRSLGHHRRARDVTAAARVTNKLQIWLLWQSCISFFPRVVSYPIPWTYVSEVKKFENNEIHCNQQYRPCLFHGEALYAEVFRRNGDSQTWIKATVVWKRTLESKVITLANLNCRRYSNESNRTQRKQRQPALRAKKNKNAWTSYSWFCV